MSIEQKIREILAEDTSEQLVEAKKSQKLTWPLPTGTKRSTSRSRKIVNMIKKYADRNGLKVHETHHELPSDFNKKADVTIHHLSPNQRGDNEPRPAEVTLSPHAESHKEHGPWLKKLLSSAETAAYNEPDWMDEDVDYFDENSEDYDDVEQLDEWDGTDASADRARRNMIRALDAATDEKTQAAADQDDAGMLTRQFPGNSKFADLKNTAKKAYNRALKKETGARAGIKAMGLRQKLNTGYEYDNDFDYLDENIDRSVELYEHLVENAEHISDDDVISIISEVVDLLPEELAVEWFSAVGSDLDEEDWSDLCESVDQLNDEGVLEEGLFSFGQKLISGAKAVGRGLAKGTAAGAKAFDAGAESVRDRLKARGKETKAKVMGKVGSTVRGAQEKLASATGTAGPGKKQNRFERSASMATKQGKQLRKASDKSRQERNRHLLGGAQKALSRLASSYDYPNLPSIDEDIAALTNGEELTEEFKEKAATIFEAAVVSRVNEELVNIQEAYEDLLEEEVATITEGLIEKVDGYLDYVVEQWMEQNEIALERGMKSEILENFVSGLKNLFEENYIDLPDEKFDVLGSMEEKIEELTADLNEQMERNVNMKKEVATYQVAQIISEASEGLVATDKDKFLSLVEELEFEDVDSFARKTQIIRENYFTNKNVSRKSTVQSVVSDTPVYLDEETNYVDPTMRNYVSVLDKLK